MSKKIFVIVICALLMVGIFLILKELATTSNDTFEVSRIIDGDTIKLSTGEKVRLIGINAPEIGQFYAAEATNKLSQLIGNNSVTLEKDVDNKDQYGRLLRYIYVGEIPVNLEMVGQGYATAYHFQPNVKYSEEFEAAEQEARNAQIGIWTPSSFTIEISDMHADAQGDDNDNLNDEYVIFENNDGLSLVMTGWTILDEANNFYDFPNFLLANGSSVTLYTGSGPDTTTQLYWGSTKPIWNNGGDTLYLRDAEGYLVTYYTYL